MGLSNAWGRPQHCLQFQRVIRGVSCLVVVEIYEHMFKFLAPGFDASSPCAQCWLAIVSLILVSSGTVQADVGEVGRDLNGTLVSGKFVDAVGGVVAVENFVDLRNIPRGIAEFENIAVMFRKAGEETVESLEIEFPEWRELKEDGAEAAAEFLDHGKELLHRVDRIVELPVVRDVAARFDGEAEVGRRFVAPAFDGAGGGQTVEAVIDFDRVEPVEVEAQHLCRWRFGRIKRTDPMLVMPA